MTVTTEELGTARVISWDNQRHRNAWGALTIERIADAVLAASVDATVRCIVVRGAGADFSAGDDLQLFTFRQIRRRGEVQASAAATG